MHHIPSGTPTLTEFATPSEQTPHILLSLRRAHLFPPDTRFIFLALSLSLSLSLFLVFDFVSFPHSFVSLYLICVNLV